jgi:hypothetical protein
MAYLDEMASGCIPYFTAFVFAAGYNACRVDCKYNLQDIVNMIDLTNNGRIVQMPNFEPRSIKTKQTAV